MFCADFVEYGEDKIKACSITEINSESFGKTIEINKQTAKSYYLFSYTYPTKPEYLKKAIVLFFIDDNEKIDILECLKKYKDTMNAIDQTTKDYFNERLK